MSQRLIAVVTGSNRGIGLAICQSLASHNGSKPMVIYATSRKGTNLAIDPSHKNEVRYAKLDITSKKSIAQFVASVLRKYQTIDILINNAGIHLDDHYNIKNATKTLDVNYRGTRHICEFFLTEGNMSRTAGARIVNVSSGASELWNYSSLIVSRFRNPDLKFTELDELAAEYLQAVRSGAEKANGWNHTESSYSVSKACLNAATFILARQNPGVLINSCCPGWVKTDMGRKVGEGGKSPTDGAKIPIRLAVGNIEDVTGKYFANPRATDTRDGQITTW